MRRALVFFALIPALIPAAGPPLPATAAAHQFAAWLDAFNSGNRETLRAYLEKNNPSRLGELDREMQFREMTGGFVPRKIEESSETRLVALLKERASDQFGRLVLQVEPAEPHRIASLEIRAIPSPPEFAPKAMSEADLVAALRARLGDGRYSGAVLLVRNGKAVFAQAYGFANRETHMPNRLDTRFRIGSMNKMFTATAILQLVQAGRIALNEPIGKYLTDYPNRDIASRVTIHQLLTHTGGTGDIFGPEFDAHRLELRTLDDYVKLYGRRGPAFEPGSRWEYSNYGFLLLGVIVEKVTGQSYYDYVREHIYDLAGMKRTGSLPEDQRVPDLSVGYTRMGGAAEHPNTNTLPYRGTSAGGGYSTVEDLVRFADALESHKLLDAHYTEVLTTGKVNTPAGRKYGYGFEERKVDGAVCFGHGGGAPGMNGDLEICPQSGYTVAVLANLDPPAASRISDFILNRLPAK